MGNAEEVDGVMEALHRIRNFTRLHQNLPAFFFKHALQLHACPSLRR